MQYKFITNKTGVGLLLLIVMALLVSVLILQNNKVFSQTATVPQCIDGTGLLVNGSTAPTTSIPANTIPVISVHSTGPNADQIIKVVPYLNEEIPLGKAVAENTYIWNMPWVTGLAGLPQGSVARLSARIYYSNSSTGTQSVCVTSQTINATINNTHAAAFNATTVPAEWAGPMSSSIAINAKTTVIEPVFDPTPYILYKWSANIGYLTPMGHYAQFSSGTTTGTGAVSVEVSYGGATRVLTVPITVKAPDAPLPVPQTTTNNTNTIQQKDTATNTNTAVDTVTSVQNPTSQDCVISAIGKDRFIQINNGAVRPTLEEIEKFKLCFATSNYVVPSNFAPIAPATIKELTSVKSIKITSLNNEKRINDNVEKNVLRIGGKAAPNSIVFIYIFSDPLVLTTTTDGEGNWEYILEDPIEPGEHEVYSVVSRGDGIYERSSPVSFKMDATAEAATINPNGLTLKLASATPAQSQRSLGLYIAGSITVLVFAIIGFIVTTVRNNKITRISTSTFSAFPLEQSQKIQTNNVSQLSQNDDIPENSELLDDNPNTNKQ
jgi:hypothetical protein